MIRQETIAPLSDGRPPDTQLHLNSNYTYFGEPVASVLANDLKRQMGASEFKEKLYYINNTQKPVTVQTRDGLSLTIPSGTSYSSTDFIVRKVLIFKGAALASAVASLNRLDPEDLGELSELKRCLSTLDLGKYSEAQIKLDYHVSLKDLQGKGGTVYHYQLDKIISFKEPQYCPPHPYSSRFLHIGAFGQTHQYVDQPEFNLKIRLVDHSPVAEKKYINIAGKVFSLQPQRDAPYRAITAKINGKTTEHVYDDYLEVFYSAKNDPAALDNKGVGHLRISLAEARETFGLYDTYVDAQNSGNIDLSRKEKLAQLLHDNDILKANLNRDRTEFELRDNEHKSAMLEAKRLIDVQQAETAALAAEQRERQTRLDMQFQDLENRRRELDMQKRSQDDVLDREKREHLDKLARQREEHDAAMKRDNRHWQEFYEMRSQMRKDTQDFVKFVPGLLIGVAGIVTAWIKFSQPSKA